MAYCAGLAPGEFSGYAVDQFVAAAGRLSWPKTALDWRCLPHSEAVAATANGTCDVLVGARLALPDDLNNRCSIQGLAEAALRTHGTV